MYFMYGIYLLLILNKWTQEWCMQLRAWKRMREGDWSSFWNRNLGKASLMKQQPKAKLPMRAAAMLRLENRSFQGMKQVRSLRQEQTYDCE